MSEKLSEKLDRLVDFSKEPMPLSEIGDLPDMARVLEAEVEAARQYIEKLENPMANVGRMAYVRKTYREKAMR